MTNQFNKEILASDFAFIKGKTNNSHLNGRIFQNSVAFSQVSTVFLQRDLVIWFRSLNLINKAGGYVTVLIEDPYVNELFSALVKNAGLEKKICVVFSSQQIQKKEGPHQLILLGDYSTSQNFFFRNLNNHIYVTVQFNYKKQKISHGVYKIYSDVCGFKKLIFFFLLLKNALS